MEPHRCDVNKISRYLLADILPPALPPSRFSMSLVVAKGASYAIIISRYTRNQKQVSSVETADGGLVFEWDCSFYGNHDLCVFHQFLVCIINTMPSHEILLFFRRFSRKLCTIFRE